MVRSNDFFCATVRQTYFSVPFFISLVWYVNSLLPRYFSQKVHPRFISFSLIYICSNGRTAIIFDRMNAAKAVSNAVYLESRAHFYKINVLSKSSKKFKLCCEFPINSFIIQYKHKSGRFW